ncbi:hypothetical protein CF386_08550 [Paraphotobacterium marinum]|uniref:Flavodoxin-like fold domain-containing protein n=1 Tax=Paraphotobacterium marinum TaxID=1755811 RepID=A0A220VFS7_9GAMM|nr:NAD(P)H-dependent oxidoreductase [Paraphotobacterium marinum]ASK79110.1 hypothetical protein CF386_08550 [Paraphotobacterium marinum]
MFISSKFSIYVYFLDYNVKIIILINLKAMSFKSKILIIYSHTGYSGEFTNKTIINALKSLDNVTINELDSNPEGLKFDIIKEQEFLIAADVLMFQFPLYWYSTPHSLKKWMDEVLQYGFAYGSEGNKLLNKHFFCSFTTGGPEKSYRAGSFNNYSMSELLKPLQQTANLCKMLYQPYQAFYDAPNLQVGLDKDVKKRLKLHIEHLHELLANYNWSYSDAAFITS